MYVLSAIMSLRFLSVTYLRSIGNVMLGRAALRSLSVYAVATVGTVVVVEVTLS